MLRLQTINTFSIDATLTVKAALLAQNISVFDKKNSPCFARACVKERM